MAKAKRGSKARLREYLQKNVGKVLSYVELREAAGGVAEFGRRIRELRNEEGMAILTHRDRADLKPGQYLLETLKPEPAFAREISKAVRAQVLDRNGYVCQSCGAAAGDTDEYGRVVRLHLAHVIDKSAGGTDDASNLRALCTACNEGASNVTAERPTYIKLLAQVRRAPASEQIRILEWLERKFRRKPGK